jgi:hypothetical protein
VHFCWDLWHQLQEVFFSFFYFFQSYREKNAVFMIVISAGSDCGKQTKNWDKFYKYF